MRPDPLVPILRGRKRSASLRLPRRPDRPHRRSRPDLQRWWRLPSDKRRTGGARRASPCEL